MHDRPLDEAYFQWLYSLVADPNIQDRRMSYWRLFRQLFKTQFVWFVPNDDNRLEDGKALRIEFLYAEGIDNADPNWIDIECSFLELVVGLSRRLEFEAGGTPHYWFWKLLENIDVRQYDDGHYFSGDIEDRVNFVMFRQYTSMGHGGFFPLNGPCPDQRRVELWRQLSTYVLQNT